ncbi:hypothetical protein E3N88_22542 [Mikania micrantha]|uniref:MBD domain-containing protein n=1 Tax=Mikania micrantha TaxID=192012 RepID=A0A5N6NAR7_9ASTR|nr:hypothetical protein E3N88_22542 [Mikania micrantha]
MEEPVTGGDDYTPHRQLLLLDAVTPISHSISSSSSIAPLSPDPVSTTNMLSNTKFKLPKGWSVRKVPRKFGGLTDKYYRDPETGLQFRSLKEVERYISEGVTPSKTRVKRLKYLDDAKVENHTNEGVTLTRTRGKRINYHHVEKMLDLEENKDNRYELAIVSSPPSPSSSTFKLPEGWIVKEIPRRSGGSADKYYYELGTGQKFRSLLAVERHITQVEENLPLSVVLEEIKENNLPLSKAFKLSSPIKNCGSYRSWKKNVMSRKEKNCLPSKVNWVIAGSGGDDAWNAYVDQTLVPDSVKQQWGNTFMISINNTKHNAPEGRLHKEGQFAVPSSIEEAVEKLRFQSGRLGAVKAAIGCLLKAVRAETSWVEQ